VESNFCLGHTAVLGAFSKVQKSGPQAALLSWFAAAGSLSRIIIPLACGNLDLVFDNSPFVVVLILLAISSILVVEYWNKLEYYIGLTSIYEEKSWSKVGKCFIVFQFVIILVGLIGMFFASSPSNTAQSNLHGDDEVGIWELIGEW